MKAMEQTTANILALNQRLLAGSLFYDTHEGNNDSEGFFKNVRHFGFEPSEIIVLSLTPDGDDTVIGRFLTKEGKLHWFDFDLDDCVHSKLTEIAEQGSPDATGTLRHEEYLEECAGKALFERGIDLARR